MISPGAAHWHWQEELAKYDLNLNLFDLVCKKFFSILRGAEDLKIILSVVCSLLPEFTKSPDWDLPGASVQTYFKMCFFKNLEICLKQPPTCKGQHSPECCHGENVPMQPIA